jgi:Protein of unknown function (DUF1573)
MMSYRVFLITLVLFVLLAFGNLIRLTGNLRSDAATAIEDQEFDFGEARVGRSVSHTFTVHNNDAHPIIITGITTSCSCTTAGANIFEIPARSSIQVPVVVLPATQSEDFRSNVALFRRDITRPIILRLKGSVIAAAPSTLDFGEVVFGRGSQLSYIVKPVAGSGNKVVSAKYDRAMFNVQWQPSSSNSAYTEVKVCLLPIVPPGPFRAAITLVTDSANESNCTTFAVGTVLDPVEFSPAQSAIDEVDGVHKWHTVKLVAPDGRSFTVTSIVSQPAGLIEVYGLPSEHQLPAEESLGGTKGSQTTVAISFRIKQHLTAEWTLFSIIGNVESDGLPYRTRCEVAVHARPAS